mmetsp:Transcript_16509/g.34508  ORF Transcript_16509/g.34508 Transcript_16509/m.34508 type:complete len:152 (-) Transcript_16509:441-896(-)
MPPYDPLVAGRASSTARCPLVARRLAAACAADGTSSYFTPDDDIIGKYITLTMLGYTGNIIKHARGCRRMLHQYGSGAEYSTSSIHIAQFHITLSHARCHRQHQPSLPQFLPLRVPYHAYWFPDTGKYIKFVAGGGPSTRAEGKAPTGCRL